MWKLAQNRFKGAMHRLDDWPTQQHLWTIALAIYGDDAAQARRWLRPLLRWLERQQNGAIDVIEPIELMRDSLARPTAKQKKTPQDETNHLADNKKRMDNKRGKRLGQPNGPGAVKSTCGQFQLRFKRTGQF